MRRGRIVEVLELGELTVAAVLEPPRHLSPAVGGDREVEEEALVGSA